MSLDKLRLLGEQMSPGARRMALVAALGNPLVYGRLQMTRDGDWTWTEVRLSDLPIRRDG